jgi:serine/threonine protein kinase
LGKIHDAGVLHCDIKPANFLFDLPDSKGTRTSNQPQCIVLADLGSSRGFNDHGHKNGTTCGYKAPAMMDGKVATAQTDLFSIAVSLAELALGSSLYHFHPHSTIQTVPAPVNCAITRGHKMATAGNPLANEDQTVDHKTYINQLIRDHEYIPFKELQQRGYSAEWTEFIRALAGDPASTVKPAVTTVKDALDWIEQQPLSGSVFCKK